MITFEIMDMTCGKCQAKIESALYAFDKTIELDFDLPQHQLSIISEHSSEVLQTELTKAGYTPVLK